MYNQITSSASVFLQPVASSSSSSLISHVSAACSTCGICGGVELELALENQLVHQVMDRTLRGVAVAAAATAGDKVDSSPSISSFSVGRFDLELDALRVVVLPLQLFPAVDTKPRVFLFGASTSGARPCDLSWAALTGAKDRRCSGQRSPLRSSLR